MIEKIRALRAMGKQIDIDDEDEFRRMMAFVLQIITATNQLLLEAAHRAEGELKQYLIDHYEEECQHEEWLREDLGGYEIPLNSLAVAIAGSQYYLLKHVHPACILGYMLVLEDPAPEEVADRMAKHGKLARTFLMHAKEDKQHLQEVLAMIDKFPEYREQIEFSATHTANLLSAYE